MRNRMDYNQACTGLVQNYIGTAYDVVKAVYDNLDAINYVYDNLKDGNFEEIVDLADEINELILLMQDYNNRYYGPLDTEPTTRPDGSPSEEGDMYYNTVTNLMYFYKEDEWAVLGENIASLEVFSIAADDLTTTGTVLTLENSYDPDNNNLMVFVNSAYQYSVSVDRPDGGYQETSSTSITFPPGYLEEDDIVVVMSGDTVSSSSVNVDVEIERHVTQTEGEIFVTIPGGMTYIPGQDNLEVFVNGIRQVLDVDYTETSETEVTFSNGLGLGSIIVFKVGQSISTSTQDFTNYFQIVNVATDFYNLAGALNTNLVTYMKGFDLPADGGAGFFIYDPLVQRNTANGGTIMDATVTVGAQGSGLGSGCWVRQYDKGISARWFGNDFATAANFQTLGFGQSSDFFTLDGYRTPGDGGEGTFYWVEDRAKTDHDGGTVIDPDKFFPVNWNNPDQMRDWYSPGVAGFGCWVRPHPEAATINWFGAALDGVTDNSFVFEGIALAIAVNNLTRLKVTAGDYVFLTNPVCKVENRDILFEMYGEGATSRLIFAQDADTRVLQFIGCTGLSFKDIAFVETRTTTNTGLSLMNCSDVFIGNCEFDDFNGSAITLTENLVTFEQEACDDVVIAGNVITQCGLDGQPAINISPKVKSKGVTVRANRLVDCGSAFGPAIQAGAALEKGLIAGNRITNAAENAIAVAAYESVEISGNIIEDFGNSGIFIYAGTQPNYTDPSVHSLGCRGNAISLSDSSIATGTYGIEIQGNRDALGLMLVSDNTFLNCGGIAILAAVPFQNVVLSDNVMEAIPALQEGIHINNSFGSAPIGLQITDNLMENEDLARTLPLMHLEDCVGVIVRGNSLNRSGNNSLELTTCSGALVLSNVFSESNVAATADMSVIQINDANAVKYHLKSNFIVKSQATSFVSCSSNTPALYVSHNIPDDIAIEMAASGTVLTADGLDTITQMGSVRHFYNTVAPLSGDYNLGDVVWNTEPAAGGSIGWVCVVSGYPGTWKEFGTIQA